MPRVKTYRSVNEIMEVFKITLWTVNSLIKKYKVDSFSSKGTMQINAKDFYKVYVTYCNPSLFGTWDEKKKPIGISTKKNDNSDIFQKLFETPYKKATKKVLLNPALIGAKDHIFG